MAQQPFTPAGVQAKLDELYVLPDASLYAEADQVRDDFSNWMKVNFALTTEQDVYLDSLPLDFITPTAFDTSMAIRYRRPITLTQLGPVSASKLVRTSPALEYTYDPLGGISVAGSVSITVEYL